MATKKENLLKKRTKLLSQILELEDFLKGNLTKVKKNSGVTAYNLTYKDKDQKTHTKYVSQEQYRGIKNKTDKMMKIKIILDAVSEINLELIKDE